MSVNVCRVPGCYGPMGHLGRSQDFARCERHRLNPDAPAMKVTCECATPDIELMQHLEAAA